MNNAHLRFGWLRYYKRTEKTTTTFKVRLDRFIGEISPNSSHEVQAHLVSIVGGDTQIAALNAAISLGERFEIEGPEIELMQACLGRNAQCHKGSLQLNGRKKPLRHLVAISEELATNAGNTGRTLLAHSSPQFVWSSLAQIHGLPGMPGWADWFYRRLQARQAIVPLLGIGCDPVLIKGSKAHFLSWLGHGVRRGELEFPVRTGPVHWPSTALADLLAPRESPADDHEPPPGARSALGIFTRSKFPEFRRMMSPLPPARIPHLR